jgi:leucyl aminopeptidase (aminopeptidase T)
MKKSILALFFALLFLSQGNLLGQVNLENTKYSSIATKIVEHTLNIQPGENVIINGTSAHLELMGELQVAVSKAGGKATIELNIPEANKRSLMETPMEYLRMPSTYAVIQNRAVDCFINVNSTQNPELFDDVPEERLAAVRQANQPFSSANRRAKFRSVSLGQVGGIPSVAYAKSVKADHEQMLNMFWNAVDTDYETLLYTGNRIADALKPGSFASVSSPQGSNITFTLDYYKARTNCGSSAETSATSGPSSTWLPAGEAYIGIVPTSANGVLVVPYTEFRGGEIENLRLTFKDGRIVNMTADKNVDLLKKALDISTGLKDVLSLIDVGINSESTQLAGSHYLSYEMAGIVTLGVGNNNWAGGNVESDFSIDFQLANTTLMVDGKILVENGQLK